MGFKYIGELATQENVNQLLTLVDMVVGGLTDTENVFDIEDALSDSEQMQKCLQVVRQHPASAKMLEERYMRAEFNLNAMLQMPKNSLGWTYAKVLSALNYDPDFYRKREITSDADYIIHRVRKTHDVHHILTGFSFDDYGELGVISVTLGQIGYPGFAFIDLVALLLSFLSDKHQRQGIDVAVEYDFDLISQGIKIARQAQLLFPVKFEEGLERPLAEWRAELNIVPVTEGHWSWYSRPHLRAAIELPSISQKLQLISV
ncbi:pyrroloquinoline quinone biosynthesis protein [Nostoc sp. CHAB 5834]|nr:pyrroloquinoline quinone biosynthesis protein [Nostoc sp. CHAB 5834]